jgi:hypothetical protein
VLFYFVILFLTMCFYLLFSSIIILFVLLIFCYVCRCLFSFFCICRFVFFFFCLVGGGGVGGGGYTLHHLGKTIEEKAIKCCWAKTGHFRLKLGLNHASPG